MKIKRKNKPKSELGKKRLSREAKMKSNLRTRENRKNRDSFQSQEVLIDLVMGRNAVREALKADRSINRILMSNTAHGGSMGEIISLAKEKKIILQMVETDKLDNICQGNRHQGIVAYAAPVDYADLDDILQSAKEKNEDPFLIILDELEDPHNLGAILRTADAVGAHGIIIPKHRSCPLSSSVARISAGALEYVPVARVNNINKTLEELKETGLWIAGADMDGSEEYYNANFKGPIALVIGNEGSGISRLTKKNCDFIVKIPMRGKVNSLNASNATAILAYEILKQRTLG